MWEQPQPNQPITDHPVVDFCMKISPFIGAAKFNLLFWVCVAVVPAKKKETHNNRASEQSKQRHLAATVGIEISLSLSHPNPSRSLHTRTHLDSSQPSRAQGKQGLRNGIKRGDLLLPA